MLLCPSKSHTTLRVHEIQKIIFFSGVPMWEKPGWVFVCVLFLLKLSKHTKLLVLLHENHLLFLLLKYQEKYQKKEISFFTLSSPEILDPFYHKSCS